MGKQPFAGSLGFTLIEIIIVLVIMGLMAAFAGPRIAKSLGGLSLRTTAKKVAGALRYAKSRSVNTGRLYSVILDCDKNRVIVLQSRQAPAAGMLEEDNATDEQEADDEEFSDARQPKETKPEMKIYPLPEGITFDKITIGDVEDDEEAEEKIYQMAFFPNGTSQGGEILLSDSRERIYSIQVDFLTGVVTVAEQTDE
jgi:type II secretion system protein H